MDKKVKDTIEKKIERMEEMKRKKLEAKNEKELDNKEGKEHSNAAAKYTGYNKKFKNEKLELAKELDKFLKNDMVKINPQFPMVYEKALALLRTREALNQQVYNIKRYSEAEYPVAKARYDILMEHRYEVYDLYQEYKEKTKKEKKEGVYYSYFFSDNRDTLLKIFKENMDVVIAGNIIKTIRTVKEEKDSGKRKDILVEPIRPVDALKGYESDYVLMTYCKKTDPELLSELNDELLKALYAEITQADKIHSTESLEIFIQFAVARRCGSQTSYKGAKREKQKQERWEKEMAGGHEVLTVNISGKSDSTLQKEYRELLKKYAKKCDE